MKITRIGCCQNRVVSGVNRRLRGLEQGVRTGCSAEAATRHIRLDACRKAASHTRRCLRAACMPKARAARARLKSGGARRPEIRRRDMRWYWRRPCGTPLPAPGWCRAHSSRAGPTDNTAPPVVGPGSRLDAAGQRTEVRPVAGRAGWPGFDAREFHARADDGDGCRQAGGRFGGGACPSAVVGAASTASA